MNLKPAKLLLGTIFAASVSAFALTAQASTRSSSTSSPPASHYMQLAGGVGDKAQGKANEMGDMESGMSNAIRERHEQHEAEERGPHDTSIEGKTKSKWHEMKGEANGAADAVEGAHERHEMEEHER